MEATKYSVELPETLREFFINFHRQTNNIEDPVNTFGVMLCANVGPRPFYDKPNAADISSLTRRAQTRRCEHPCNSRRPTLLHLKVRHR